jgi:hypothetical protein
LRRRKSSLIDGAAPDAAELTAHLVAYLDMLAADHSRTPLGLRSVTKRPAG